jgi:hypothetical protein
MQKFKVLITILNENVNMTKPLLARQELMQKFKVLITILNENVNMTKTFACRTRTDEKVQASSAPTRLQRSVRSDDRAFGGQRFRFSVF